MKLEYFLHDPYYNFFPIVNAVIRHSIKKHRLAFDEENYTNFLELKRVCNQINDN